MYIHTYEKNIRLVYRDRGFRNRGKRLVTAAFRYLTPVTVRRDQPQVKSTTITGRQPWLRGSHGYLTGSKAI